MRTALAIAALAVVVDVGSSASAQDGDEGQPVATEAVTLVHGANGEAAVPAIVDELAPETVLRIRALDFDADTTGTVRQCVDVPDPTCANPLPVRFDSEGRAVFQYLVTDDIGISAGDGERCRLADTRCTIELSVGAATSTIATVFVDAAPPPGRLDVAPARDLHVGDTVTVRADGFPPASQLRVTVCAPSNLGPQCGPPAPVVALRTGPDGTAQADLVLDVAAVGTERVACDPQAACTVVLLTDDISVRADPVAISFADRPGAAYSRPRLMAGLVGVLALLLLAGWMLRTTDWSPPRESGSPALDGAELADLDREAAEFAERETSSL